jgi:hypothetical protein
VSQILTLASPLNADGWLRRRLTSIPESQRRADCLRGTRACDLPVKAKATQPEHDQARQDANRRRVGLRRQNQAAQYSARSDHSRGDEAGRMN